MECRVTELIVKLLQVTNLTEISKSAAHRKRNRIVFAYYS